MADEAAAETNVDENIVVLEETNSEIEAQDVDKVHNSMQNFSNFIVEEVLRNNPTQKQIAVVGKFKGLNKTALIVLEKKSFPNEQLELTEGFFNDTTVSKKRYRNDIYRDYDIFPVIEHNGLSARIIYPANAKHIEKFTPPEYFLVEETPEMYNNVSLKYIQEQQLSLKWVDNILNGTAEADRVIFDDKNEETGFVMVKDFKWKDEVSMLYLIAITRLRIASIRDLNETHLPLLRNIKESGLKAISEKYNIPANKLRIFFHYQPSYYHLHVHFTTFEVENAGAFVERAHFLTTVIRNIELMPDYYQKATLSFRVSKYDLYKPYEDYINRDEENQMERPAKRPRFSC